MNDHNTTAPTSTQEAAINHTSSRDGDNGNNSPASETKLEAIAKRWERAAYETNFNISFLVPLICNESNRITINDIELDCTTPNNPRYEQPLISIYVWHTEGRIVGEGAFERAISHAISQHIQRSVRVVLDDNWREDGSSFMRCVDAESKWHIADYMLDQHRF